MRSRVHPVIGAGENLEKRERILNPDVAEEFIVECSSNFI
jgi:hypothetical protein